MNSLSRIYGKPLTSVFIGLLVFWLAFLIVLPQAFMIDQSLWQKKSSEAEVTTKLAIDNLYNDLSLLQIYDLAEAKELPDNQAQVDELLQQEIDLKIEIKALEEVEVTAVKTYTISNYTAMSGYHIKIFVKTIGYSLMVTVLSLIVCYPIAFIMAHVVSKKRMGLMMLGVVVPYAINELLRIYSWLMILDYRGVLNLLLSYVGVTNFDEGRIIPFLEYPGSVFAAMVYAYILFMLFPIYNTIETLDKNQIEASHDLGAGVIRTHLQVVIPHAKPGIAVGCIMTFMLSVGSYAAPHIISRGKQEKWFSQLIYDKFYDSNNWNVGSAYAFTLLIVCLIFIMAMMKLFGVGIKDISK